MTTATALKKAQALKPSQPKQAAHLYATVEWELAYLEQELDNPLMEDRHPELEQQRSAGEAALARIEETFPDIKAQADEIEAPRSLSARATAGLSADQEHDEPQTSEAAPPPGAGETSPAPASSSRAPQPGQTARRRRSAARARRSFPRNPVVNVAGSTLSLVNQSTGGWGDEIWDFALGGVGLAVFFLILSQPAGVSKLVTGLSNLVNWVVNPSIDPLRPTGATTS
jgi:hypothetical protein